MQQDEKCDVLVVGGGPAGSTMAALHARHGRKVVLLEKDHHPRFHIGESLLPGNVALFEQLGVRDQIEKIGMPKYGIEFVPPDLDYCSYVDFAEGWDPKMASAWQVRRSERDEVLFRHAAAQGAQALEGVKVRDVVFDDQGARVEATLEGGETRHWRARFVVDASGRDTFLANKFGSSRDLGEVVVDGSEVGRLAVAKQTDPLPLPRHVRCYVGRGLLGRPPRRFMPGASRRFAASHPL